MNIDSIRNSYTSNQIHPTGNQIRITTTNPLHYGGEPKVESNEDITESFAEVFKKSLEKVNDAQVHADDLTQKMVFNPNSVDAHEVMIAAEKARISLTFTKTVVDGIIRAYKELSNLR